MFNFRATFFDSEIIDSDSDDDFQEFEARPSTSKVQRKEDTLETEEGSSGQGFHRRH